MARRGTGTLPQRVPALTLAAGAFVAGGLLCFACAKGDNSIIIDGDDDAAITTEGGSKIDRASPVEDGSSSGTSGTSGTSGSSGDDSGTSGCTGKVVINELSTRGATQAEIFVELYNPNACAIPLGGYRLSYRAKTNVKGPDLVVFQNSDSIAAKAFLVAGSSAFKGKKDVTLTNSGVADEGQIGLLDAQMKLVDGVAFGQVATGDYLEGQSAPVQPNDNGSIARKQDGADTGNNKNDFAAASTHSAGAAN